MRMPRYGLFIGEGDQRKRLEKKTAELCLQDHVIFAGLRRDMINVYRSLDLFAMSSIDEGLPLVLCEALAMKVPVVATRVGAIPRVVTHNETALLSEAKDIDTLAKNLSCMLADATLREAMREKGRQLAETKLSSLAMAKRYHEVYTEILK